MERKEHLKCCEWKILMKDLSERKQPCLSSTSGRESGFAVICGEHPAAARAMQAGEEVGRNQTSGHVSSLKQRRQELGAGYLSLAVVELGSQPVHFPDKYEKFVSLWLPEFDTIT